MREESRQWFEQSKRELFSAKALFDVQAFDTCCFLCHQAAEKSLKAVVIEVKKVLPPKTHELMALGREAGAKELLADLQELNPHFLTSRYPDAANGVPSETYNSKIALRCIEIAEKVVAWSTKKIS